MTPRVFAAVDLGASSGRVVAGAVDGTGDVRLEEVHRFGNVARRANGHLRWDVRSLYAQVLDGLGHLAARYPQVESIGIDTWGVDYGILDADGELIDDPVSHRDDRTADVIDAVHDRIRPAELYERCGVQYLPFNTIYQLAAERSRPTWSRAAHVVLLPDLLAYWLTGALATEATNASTTGMLDVTTGDWATDLLARLDLDPRVLPPIERAGAVRGPVCGDVRERVGLRTGVVVTTVGSHDTASAVVALPATEPGAAFVSSGTWSLAGIELTDPVVTDAARSANFSNELGVDDRTRFLRNVGGLWLLQECIRTWNERGGRHTTEALLNAAGDLPPGGPTFDVDDPAFIPPGDMPGRIADALDEPPPTPEATTRAIVDSLATAYARTIASAGALASTAPTTIHVVGGGSHADLLCQLTADTSGLAVHAGPAEATSLGNVLVQARTHGAAPSTLAEMRTLVARRPDVRSFQPRPTIGAVR